MNDQPPCVVVVAPDLACSAKNTLHQAYTQALARSGRLLVCHVRRDPGMLDADQQALREGAEQTLGPGATDIEACVLSGHPAEVLSDLVHARSAELIVIGANDDTMLLERTLDGATERMLRTSRAAVLIVRPPFGLRVLVATDLSSPSLPAIAAAEREATRRK